MSSTNGSTTHATNALLDAVENSRTARGAVAARPVADDAWLGGAAEPGTDDQAPQGNGRRRPAPPPRPAYKLTTRKPTGVPTWPTILVEGPAYTFKTTLAVEAANDPRIGHTTMLSLGEDVDWLGAIADFDIVEHNGEWWQIQAAAEQLAQQCHREVAEDPTKAPLVIIDSGTEVWELLGEWVDNRAIDSPSNRRKLATDPNAEINAGPTFWNPANRRFRRFVRVLRNMPAIVVVTARGGEVAAIGADGNPISGKKEYSVRIQKDFPFATTAHVRLAKGEHPAIVSARMAKGEVRPGRDAPKVIDPDAREFRPLREKGWEGFSLPWLVFDVMKFDPTKATTSKAIAPVAGSAPDPADLPTPLPPAPDDATEPAGAGPSTADVTPNRPPAEQAQ